jgi:hypothetical protein
MTKLACKGLLAWSSGLDLDGIPLGFYIEYF